MGLRELHRRRKSAGGAPTPDQWTHTDPNHYYGYRNLFDSANTHIIQVRRSSDNALTNVLMPSYGGFIGPSSTVSAGGTLSSWAGTDSVYTHRFYDQIGSIDAISLVSTGVTGLRILTSGSFEYDVNGFIRGYNASAAANNMFKADNINGGSAMGVFSLLIVGSWATTDLNNQIVGFGHPANGDSTSGKVQFRIAADNTIRNYGSFEPALVASTTGNKIWSVQVNSSNNRKMYVNGVKVCDSATGLAPVDDFFLAAGVASSFNNYMTECFIYKSDIIAERAAMETTLNSKFNYY